MASKEWLADWQRRIQEVLQGAGAASAPCPVCGGRRHQALPFVQAPWTHAPGKGFSAAGYELLPLVCQGCGHVRFFGATPLIEAAGRTSTGGQP